ncbi:restriction endonuclease [Leeuwenhoekiella polynyae]|uniref:Restriction endonuclease n=1 Tax=Leeuwenhoekiella polynyae TaxID=1550906 RepID=A0A4Q0NQV9_9FLAO|nr:restriction endonuclease [Leeuwenhoekiella polynyae]RXG13022.1 restriction endonuclease [Leeuwenhoekiella polynyae]
MSNYDFSTLSPFDFEELACDLLNAHYEKENFEGNFRTFGPGRDKGIDLLLSTPNTNFEIIGQVKHYVKSSFSKLLRDLKNIEKDKVFLLNPKRYVIVTSQELSPDNKIEIKAAFEPYITTLGDIFGRQDLNKILRQNKYIEEKHFKLWFSSTLILDKILNYKFEGRRKEFTDTVLKRKFRLFVETNNFLKAKSILNENKFIIITGEPGVGKSTLSDMMIYDFIKDDYQINIIYDDIKEVEINLRDDKSKQVFYFDDFLGHTQAEINKSKSAENSLLRIISRIENLDHKFLILNTRKFILTSFLDESERFRNFNPLRSEAKIELQSYSYDVKKRMIENHIQESTLSPTQIDVINK